MRSAPRLGLSTQTAPCVTASRLSARGDRDRLADRLDRPRVDARDRLPLAVEHPDGALARGDG